MEIRGYFNLVWKRKAIIAISFLLFTLASVIFNYGILVSQYRATAKVLVEPRSKVVVFMSEQPRNMPPALDIETYVKMLKSLKVATMAAKNLGYKQDAEKQASNLVNRINVASEEDTGIISISVDDANPKKCTSIANAYAEAFESLSKNMARESINDVEMFLNKQLQIAKEKEEEHSKTIKKYKADNNIIDPTTEAARENEVIHALTGELLKAGMEKNASSVRLAEYEELYRRFNDNLKAGVAKFDVGDMDFVDKNLQTLKFKKMEMEQKYVPDHPMIKEIDEQIRKLERLKKKATSEIVNGLTIGTLKYEQFRDKIDEYRVAAELARSNETALGESLKLSLKKKAEYPDYEYTLNKLQRENDVSQTLVDMLNKQLLETSIQKNQNPTKVQILDRAIEPRTPTSPNREKNISIFMVLGLIVGIGIAFLLEEMEESVRTSDDVKNYLNLPVLGSIPYSAETINKLITDVPLKSPIAEAYRRLSFFTQLFCLDPPIKLLLITSSKSDEGKSTTLANMAISMAQEGTKVIIVDTDLRRPMLHRMFGMDNSLGLSSLLSGELEAELAVSDLASGNRLPRESLMDVLVDRIVQPSQYKGLGVIPSGPLPANSIELLRGERMLSFLRVVEKKADIVLFDSPPAIHVIDAVVLSQILDGVLMVINSGRIDREEALQVKYMVESTKTPIIGVALNNIEAASPDYYYYYYYGGYGYGSRQRRKRVKLKR